MLLSIIFFTAALMLKGGWLGRIPGWNEFAKYHPHEKKLKDYASHVKAWFLDGTQLSAFLVWVYLAAAQPYFIKACGFAFIWWIIVMTSMDEEAGAVGDYKGGWGPYVESAKLGRSFGVRKAEHYGLLGGCLLAIVSGCDAFVVALATFPLCYFAGNSLHLYLHKYRSWAYSEIIWGAVIGVAAGLWLNQ